MKIGILGTGFGSYHLELYQQIDQNIEVIIWGRNEEKLGEIKEKFGCSTTSNIEDILGDSSIELVDVCLPTSVHKKYAIMVLRSGKDVLLETPAVICLEEGVDILKAIQETGKQVYVDMFTRYEPAYEYLYNVNKKNSYGQLKHLFIYRRTPALWGSLGLDTIHTSLMIHDLDFICWLMGKPNIMYNYGIENKEKSGAHVDCQLLYEQGMVHLVGNSMEPMGYPFAVGYEAVFESGSIKYYENGYKDHAESRLEIFKNGGKEEVELIQETHCRRVLESILESRQDGDISRLKFEEALVSLELALKIQNHL